MGNIHRFLGARACNQQRLGCCVSRIYWFARSSRHRCQVETRKMKRLWYKLKSGWWKFVLGFVVLASLLIYFYRLLKPADDRVEYLETIKTEATLALKEAELRGRLEKDKIGAVKSVFQNRLRDTEKIDDREERLKALIRLHKELDI